MSRTLDTLADSAFFDGSQFPLLRQAITHNSDKFSLAYHAFPT